MSFIWRRKQSLPEYVEDLMAREARANRVALEKSSLVAKKERLAKTADKLDKRLRNNKKEHARLRGQMNMLFAEKRGLNERLGETEIKIRQGHSAGRHVGGLHRESAQELRHRARLNEEIGRLTLSSAKTSEKGAELHLEVSDVMRKMAALEEKIADAYKKKMDLDKESSLSESRMTTPLNK